MPRHPNVLRPAHKLATLGDQRGDGDLVAVCGTLQPLYAGGDLGSRIEKSNALGARIPLEMKAWWCPDMAAAVAQNHRHANTYRMESDRPRLRYTEYAGPPRRNVEEDVLGD
ncbi:nima-related kinase 5 [Colletotrichum sojae]|uniref:Nima-related kinase 5 n=1 Tax=Colletotrichum sojae TaxID=2175907 RepID=A0A8H6MKG2_9PEZI|nr:nima-related kinase 5 [Colletotrichum sojae]